MKDCDANMHRSTNISYELPKNFLWFQIILVVVWGAVMALIINALR